MVTISKLRSDNWMNGRDFINRKLTKSPVQWLYKPSNNCIILENPVRPL